jgi:hypothetical protein
MGLLNLRWHGVHCCLSPANGTSPLERGMTIYHRPLRGLVAVTFASSPLRYPCSDQRVHSGLYDGLTWPDIGCASLD